MPNNRLQCDARREAARTDNGVRAQLFLILAKIVL